MNKKWLWIFLAIATVLIFSGKIYLNIHKKKLLSANEQIYRPVSVIKLHKTDPERALRLTGIVKTWKEENLSFEVGGRIDWMIEKGMEVDGSSHGIDIPAGGGTIIAKIDPARYILKYKSLQARIESVEARAEALRVAIDQVMIKSLDAVNADLSKADQKFQRTAKLLSQNATSKQSYDDTEAEYKVAQARQAETTAQIVARRAEYKSQLALVDELKQQLKDAELDIEKCVLRSPYKGQVAEVTANIGANVQAGTKVARVVVMNPVVIGLEVSPRVDRLLKYRDYVTVYPPGMDQPVHGMVNLKSTVADPHTHTFNLELLVLNYQLPVAGNHLEPYRNLKEIGGVWRVENFIMGSGNTVRFVEEKAVSHDADGEYVWLASAQNGNNNNNINGIQLYKLKKVRVKLEKVSHNVMGLYNFRLFSAEETHIAAGDWLAFNVPGGIKDDDTVIEITRRWLFRPGDMAKVVLNQNLNPPGYYVPVEAIVHDNEQPCIYVVQRINGQNHGKVQAIPVTLQHPVGAYTGITSAKLSDNMEVIIKGVHFLRPEDIVTVKEIEELTWQ